MASDAGDLLNPFPHESRTRPFPSVVCLSSSSGTFGHATPQADCATEVLMLSLVLPLALLVGSVSAGQEGRPTRQLPPPTDTDPKLTEQSRELEQQLCDAILRKDAGALDRLVAPEFTLRVADVPQSSLPRTIWMDNVKRLKPESCEQRHHAARKLADNLAVVSLLQTQKATTDGRNFGGDFYIVDFWKRSSADWRIIAGYL